MRYFLTLALLTLALGSTACLSSGDGGGDADAGMPRCPALTEAGFPKPGTPTPCGFCVDDDGREYFFQCVDPELDDGGVPS